MDPSKSKSTTTRGNNNNTERQFVIQILWLSLAGGTASFIRVSTMLYHIILYIIPYRIVDKDRRSSLQLKLYFMHVQCCVCCT